MITPLRSTGVPPTAEARSTATAQINAKARPGQRPSAATEVPCSAQREFIFVLTSGSTLLHPGRQQQSADGDAGSDTQTELPKSDRAETSRHLPTAQSSPERLARVLRKSLSVGDVPRLFRHCNKTLVAWAMRKYRRLKDHKIQASRLLEQLSEKQPYLFVHWQKGMVGAFA